MYKIIIAALTLTAFASTASVAKQTGKFKGVAQISINEPACKRIETFKEWAKAIAAGDDAAPIPEAPECLDIPVRTKVKVTGKTETIQQFGEPALYHEIIFKGVSRWIGRESLEPISPKPKFSKEALAVIADMKKMYKEMERVRHMPIFHRCMYGACSPIKKDFHRTWLERSWDDLPGSTSRELRSKGVGVTAVDIWMMAKIYANTKGKGDDFTQLRDMQLRTLIKEY